MATNRPVCKYGGSCYRKNPQHLRAYFHPNSINEENETVSVDQKRKHDSEIIEDDNSVGPSKRAKLKQHSSEKTRSSEIIETEKKTHNSDSSSSPPKQKQQQQQPPQKQKQQRLQEQQQPKVKQQISFVPLEDNIHLRKRINELCLVVMPEDFYQFWHFCMEINPEDPSNALNPSLGLVLTGPYDILSGRLQLDELSWDKSVIHGRHFYDPPEMQTVLMDDCNDTGFHIGYYRDEPNSNNCFLVSNTVSKGCRITQLGTNIFASIKSLLQKPIKDSVSQKLVRELNDKLTKKATSLGIDLTGTIKRQVVAKCFNQIGISVPYNKETLVGYRPLTMRNDQLKSVLNKIVNQSLDSAVDDLQELITFTQFANDESDYGMALELGIDLFCYGDPKFHGKILNLLTVVYDLLDRPAFGKIIERHLKFREKPKFVLKM